MVVVPAATPVSIPLAEPIEAMVVEAELHVPPDVALPSVVVNGWQTVAAPVIEPGIALILITVVATQPVPSE
jgi:hypothetical protein